MVICVFFFFFFFLFFFFVGFLDVFVHFYFKSTVGVLSELTAGYTDRVMGVEAGGVYSVRKLSS